MHSSSRRSVRQRRLRACGFEILAQTRRNFHAGQYEGAEWGACETALLCPFPPLHRVSVPSLCILFGGERGAYNFSALFASVSDGSDLGPRQLPALHMLYLTGHILPLGTQRLVRLTTDSCGSHG